MTDKAIYGPIAGAVKTYLDHDQWRYTERPKPNQSFISFQSRIGLPHLSVTSFFDADDDDKRFSVFVYCELNVPEEHRLKVAEFLTRVNYRIHLGKIEMDLDDGQIRSTTAISLKDVLISQAMIEDMENAAHFSLNDAYPGIMGIAYGDQTPDEAFAGYSTKDSQAVEASP